jgi:signal transduction histidine kinase
MLVNALMLVYLVVRLFFTHITHNRFVVKVDIDIILVITSLVFSIVIPTGSFLSTLLLFWLIFLLITMLNLKQSIFIGLITCILITFHIYIYRADSKILLTLWLYYISLSFFKIYIISIEENIKNVKKDLRQAKWAATKFANLNIEYQDKIRCNQETIMVRERSRIAHEIHDTVGHSLTAVLYSLNEIKRSYLQHNADICTQLNETIPIVSNAMSEVRKAVYSLNEPDPIDFSWPVRWRRLCRTFAELTGVMIRVNLPENLPFIPDNVGENTLKIIQETLTNSIRHGCANHIDVTALYKENSRLLLLRISDDGIGADKVVVGMGLSGIIEKAKSVNGSIAWITKRDCGFDLGLEIII